MNRLKELRTARGFSQERLAREIGTSQQTISRIEAGKALIPTDLAVNASDFFHISLDYLLGLSEERYNQTVISRFQHRILKYEELLENMANLHPDYQHTVHLMIRTLLAELEKELAEKKRN